MATVTNMTPVAVVHDAADALALTLIRVGRTNPMTPMQQRLAARDAVDTMPRAARDRAERFYGGHDVLVRIMGETIYHLHRVRTGTVGGDY